MLARMSGGIGRRAWAYSKLLLALAVACVVWSWSETAHAYTWMIRHGYTACGTCHADPSGGELLTTYGRAQGDLLLRMHYGGSASSDDSGKSAQDEDGEKPAAAEEASEPTTGFLWGLWDTPEWLLLGGSYRNLNVYRPTAETNQTTIIPVMQADLYGQVRFGAFRAAASGGISRVRVGSPHARAAQVTTGQGEELNLISRTHWVGVDIADKYTVRAGRLNLPFGLRMPEHTTWVRESTMTDRESDQQHGVSLAYVGESLRAEIMGIAGNYQIQPQEVRERGYSAFVESVTANNLAIGVSSKVTTTSVDRFTGEENVLRQAHGIMGRWAPFHQLVLMVEADMLFRTNADAGYVGFAQADYEIVQGLHFMLTGEVLDEGRSIASSAPPIGPGLGKAKLGGWASIDWFFANQFELRVDLISRQTEPLTVLGQLHFYL